MTKRSITIIFVAVIIFCLCYIQAILAEQNRIVKETYELTAQPDDVLKSSTVGLVKQIDGVKEAGYYMTSALKLTVGDCSVNINVHALPTDYKINDKYIVGSGLILNESAIDAIVDEYEENKKSFTDYYTPKYNLGSDEFLFNLDKIIENKTDNEAATAYISLNQMSQLMNKLEMNSEANLLRVKLTNFSYLTSVKEKLDNYDLTIISDTKAIKEESETYGIHILYLSLILAVSFLAIIREYKDVNGKSLLIGYFLGIIAAFSLPYLFPPAERSTIVFGLSASDWFYFVVFAVVAIICVFSDALSLGSRGLPYKSNVDNSL